MSNDSTTSIRSEIAGKVLTVDVDEGARVAEGQQLFLLESMKMEIPVLAPSAGVIQRILVREEQLVEEDQELGILHAPT